MHGEDKLKNFFMETTMSLFYDKYVAKVLLFFIFGRSQRMACDSLTFCF